MSILSFRDLLAKPDLLNCANAGNAVPQESDSSDSENYVNLNDNIDLNNNQVQRSSVIEAPSTRLISSKFNKVTVSQQQESSLNLKSNKSQSSIQSGSKSKNLEHEIRRVASPQKHGMNENVNKDFDYQNQIQPVRLTSLSPRKNRSSMIQDQCSSDSHSAPVNQMPIEPMPNNNMVTTASITNPLSLPSKKSSPIFLSSPPKESRDQVISLPALYGGLAGQISVGYGGLMCSYNNNYNINSNHDESQSQTQSYQQQYHQQYAGRSPGPPGSGGPGLYLNHGQTKSRSPIILQDQVDIGIHSESDFNLLAACMGVSAQELSFQQQKSNYNNNSSLQQQQQQYQQSNLKPQVQETNNEIMFSSHVPSTSDSVNINFNGASIPSTCYSNLPVQSQSQTDNLNFNDTSMMMNTYYSDYINNNNSSMQQSSSMLNPGDMTMNNSSFNLPTPATVVPRLSLEGLPKQKIMLGELASTVKVQNDTTNGNLNGAGSTSQSQSVLNEQTPLMNPDTHRSQGCVSAGTTNFHSSTQTTPAAAGSTAAQNKKAPRYNKNVNSNSIRESCVSKLSRNCEIPENWLYGDCMHGNEK